MCRALRKASPSRRTVPVVRRVDGRFHRAAGGVVITTQFFFPLHFHRNATEQLRNEMAPKRFRLPLYKPTTWQCGALPVACERIPRPHWPRPDVRQTGRTPTSRPRPPPATHTHTLGTCCSLTFGHNGNTRGFKLAISAPVFRAASFPRASRVQPFDDVRICWSLAHVDFGCVPVLRDMVVSSCYVMPSYYVSL